MVAMGYLSKMLRVISLLLVVHQGSAQDFLINLEPQLETAKADYLLACSDQRDALWMWINNPDDDHMERKITADEDLGYSQRENADLVGVFSEAANVSENLQSNIDMLVHPGNAVLWRNEYRELVRFSTMAQLHMRNGKFPCSNSEEPQCSINSKDIPKLLTSTADPEELRKIWLSFHESLQPLLKLYPEVLSKIASASKKNGASSVEEYWLKIEEYPAHYKNISILWNEVQPLYQSLHSYVRKRLKHQCGEYAFENPNLLPVHLLGSFTGKDWTGISELVAPPFDTTLTFLNQTLVKKEYQGLKLYKSAAGFASKLSLPYLNELSFWENLSFNGTCPAQIIRPCHGGNIRLKTCNTSGLLEYMDAHKTVMTAIETQVVHKNQRNIFRELNRESALHPAMQGLLYAMAVMPERLKQLNLLSTPEVELSTNETLSLRLLLALNVLPKLAHAYTAYMWRLNLLDVQLQEENNEELDEEMLMSRWSEYRKTIQGIEAPYNTKDTWEFIADDMIADNKPYIGEFVGTILQFQILEKLIEDSESNPVEVMKNDGSLKKLLAKGSVSTWSELLESGLGIDQIDTSALLEYFKPLEDLFSRELPVDTPRMCKTAPTRLMSSELVQTTESSENNESLPESSTSKNPKDIVASTESTLQASPGASQAILFTIIGAVGVFLVVGVFFIGRKFYRRKYQRNRRDT